jgi:hypothetical protein
MTRMICRAARLWDGVAARVFSGFIQRIDLKSRMTDRTDPRIVRLPPEYLPY